MTLRICLCSYCECFAAGVYCIEPCACQDCFNKPIHEDTVLATRKQIESRNPLAFAPKVIRSSESASEFGVRKYDLSTLLLLIGQKGDKNETLPNMSLLRLSCVG